MEQTTLQKIIKQKAEQIRIAIEEAIDAGAKIKNKGSYVETMECCDIDRVFLQKDTGTSTISVVLYFSSDKIAKVFEPSKDDLEKLAEQKRHELEEIENKIKERAKE